MAMEAEIFIGRPDEKYSSRENEGLDSDDKAMVPPGKRTTSTPVQKGLYSKTTCNKLTSDESDYKSGSNHSTDDEGELKSDDESNPAGSHSSEEGEVLSELEETTSTPVQKGLYSKTTCNKLTSDESDYKSGSNHSTDDEGELKSDDESNPAGSHSSEEGEVLSELEEMDVATEESAVKEETPWERGLRLARERIEKVKALKASEKDIVEKRMNLAVPAVTDDEDVDEELANVPREDVLWQCYYQTSIIGRTELTCRRFLPEDIQPPTAAELSEWRLGLSNQRRGRQRHRNRRHAANHHRSSYSASSRSASSSSGQSSSSRHSSSSSSRGSSDDGASSLASVAASWRATCARAMKDYLSSPIRNKDRRFHRGSPSASSDSRSSRSSDSQSDRSVERPMRSRGFPTGKTVANTGTSASHAGPQTGNRSRPPDQTRTRRSGSSASKSSGSASGHRRRGEHDWNYGNRRPNEAPDWQESPNRSDSGSPSRGRIEAPLLPHERPVKRPWVADPGFAANMTDAPGKGNRRRHRSASRSGSASSRTGEERRFITSWSKSPSPGNTQRTRRDVIRRDRLPDVVPGEHLRRPGHSYDPGSPTRRRKSRSPFADPNIAAAAAMQRQPMDHRSSGPQSGPYDGEDLVHRSYRQPPAIPSDPAVSHYRVPSSADKSDLSTAVASGDSRGSASNLPAGGELPSASSRPGVRMTLAPRLKASAVDMANIPGSATRPTGRSAPSPPRLPKLPFPIPSRSSPSHMAPASSYSAIQMNYSGSTNTATTTTAPPPIPAADQEEVRRQAEAVATVVEARERRRAAAEEARRRRNPNRKKRDDMSNIPIRGRPTYRRVSFSDSSGGSGSGSGSSASGSRSRSRASSRATPDNGEPEAGNNKDYQPRRSQPRPEKRRQMRSNVQVPMDNYGQRDVGGGANMDDRFMPNYPRSQQQQPTGPMYDNYARDYQQRPGDDMQGMMDPRRTPRQRSKMPYDNPTGAGGGGGQKYRTDRSSFRHGAGNNMGPMYKGPNLPNPVRNTYMDQGAGGFPSGQSRHREARSGMMSSRYAHPMDDPMAAPRYDSRRGGGGGIPPSARPRSPHAADISDASRRDHYDIRSPHAADTGAPIPAPRLNRRKRPAEDEPFMMSSNSSRKRAVIVEPPGPEQSMEPSSMNSAELRRARSRHRSRGPGTDRAPIDRSEPFESDAGGFAAEQRLRDLRERLNLVDDAIAEIKAGSVTSGFGDTRR